MRPPRDAILGEPSPSVKLDRWTSTDRAAPRKESVGRRSEGTGLSRLDPPGLAAGYQPERLARLGPGGLSRLALELAYAGRSVSLRPTSVVRLRRRCQGARLEKLAVFGNVP